MLNWDNWPLAHEVYNLYEGAPLPVAVVDGELLTVWANKRAMEMFPSLSLPDGIQQMLTEDELSSAQQAVQKGSSFCVSPGHLPLCATGLFFAPFPQQEKAAFTLVHFLLSGQEPSGSASQMVAAFSSQIRDPLSSIFASLSSLARYTDTQPPKFSTHLQLINQNGYRILRHCVNLTEFSRFTSATNPAEYSLTDLKVLIGELCKSAQSLTHAIGIPLYCTLPEKELLYLCDVQKLQSILLNLISNSCKFTREGNAIDISLEETGNRLKLTVTDHGQGIDPEVLPFVFNPFYAHGPQGGGGLGLTVVKLSITAMGGTVAIYSQPGSGTTVALTIPTRPPKPTIDEPILGAPHMAEIMCNRFSPLYILLSDSCQCPWP